MDTRGIDEAKARRMEEFSEWFRTMLSRYKREYVLPDKNLGFGRRYCRWFNYRPQVIQDRLLCTGGEEGYWPACPDFRECSAVKPRRPAPAFVLRMEDASNAENRKDDDSAR